MAYVRVSTMRPKPGREAEAEAVSRELIDFYREQPGCLHSTFVNAMDGSSEIGRITFWESSAVADRAAMRERSIYLRSRLHLAIEKGHQDRSFEAAAEEVPARAKTA
ncbi:MAG TPA: antibiotic biosynthesis monooxygenase [Dehalococcoidia bacterium]|nr:antibiotic biosynthesis monooxygenase [Dehalococcoidia bacterium]